VGGSLGRSTPRTARRRAYLRSRRRPRAASAQSHTQGRRRRLRRHPHERHPLLPLRISLGGARRTIGRQSRSARRGGAPRPRAARGRAHGSHHLSAGAGQRSARRAPRRPHPRRRRPRPVKPTDRIRHGSVRPIVTVTRAWTSRAVSAAARDPRYLQIAFLATFLSIGLAARDFPIWHAPLLFAAALGTQLACIKILRLRNVG